jgi:hypothetical protein
MPGRRALAASVATAALAAVLCASDARSEASAMTCTNDASGATWRISVDYGRSTVDSYPARISDATIAWHDAKDGGNYTLDRKSGKLTVVAASSTGGYFLYHHCGTGR